MRVGLGSILRGLAARHSASLIGLGEEDYRRAGMSDRRVVCDPSPVLVVGLRREAGAPLGRGFAAAVIVAEMACLCPFLWWRPPLGVIGAVGMLVPMLVGVATNRRLASLVAVAGGVFFVSAVSP